MHWQAGSPDEAALVVAAKVFGFFFHARTLRGVKASHSRMLDKGAPWLQQLMPWRQLTTDDGSTGQQSTV